MKIDKDILSKIFSKCKEYPCATMLGGVGGAIGLILTIALGGMGYMIDTKNDMYEDMAQINENNKEEL